MRVDSGTPSVALTWCSPEVGHEVDDQVEEDRVEDLVRHIGKHRGESFGRRVVTVIGQTLDSQ